LPVFRVWDKADIGRINVVARAMQKQHTPMSKAPHIKSTVAFLTNGKTSEGKPAGVGSIAAVPTGVSGSATALQKKLATPIPLRKQRPARPRKLLLAGFKFQAFKKCFNPKCKVLIVPGDFKPSSPRRMFCSSDCFAEHWRKQLAVVFSGGSNAPTPIQDPITKLEK